MRQSISVKLTEEWLETARDAAWWARTKLNAILERGALAELERLESIHNEGKPFPQRKDDYQAARGASEGIPLKIVSFELDVALVERLRNAGAFLKRAYTNMIREGAEAEIIRLQNKHNQGRPFGPREEIE